MVVAVPAPVLLSLEAVNVAMTHVISESPGKYCHMFLCVHCLKENVACTQNGQCCKGQCVYGRCKKEGASGKPGTFCDRHEDCTDPAGTCCVR